jgi:hypothetical protein
MDKKPDLVDPRTKYHYTLQPDGCILVEDPATGKQGRFGQDAQHIDGELNYANRQLLGWVGRRYLLHKDGG